MNNGLMVRMDIALQLLKMDDRQLFRLHNLIEEYATDNDIIDISKFLPCDKCREKYGECSEETSDCESRFLEFCEEEAP